MNGTFRMNSKDIDAFYHANLYINVASENHERELRGRIVQHFLGPAQEFAIRPILLEGGSGNNATVSGLAWLTVDTTCRLHYQVVILLEINFCLLLPIPLCVSQTVFQLLGMRAAQCREHSQIP